MVSVCFTQPIQIDTQRDYVAACDANVPYLVTDYHVHTSIPPDICIRQQHYAARSFEGQTLEHKSLLIHWAAGLGDTVASAPAVISLQRDNPRATIDVVSIPSLFEIWAAAGFEGRLLPYPVAESVARQYDYFLPIEGYADHPGHRDLELIDFMAALFYQPAGLQPVRLTPRAGHRSQHSLDATVRKRIGVQVRGLSPLRTYPSDLLADVLRGIVKQNHEVHLFGQAGDCNIPSAAPLVHNHCGHTTHLDDLLTLLGNMDALICPDSYLMHIAGSLALPTIAIFSTIPPETRCSRYPTVTSLQPDADCAPCHVILDQHCPLGHPECVALRTHQVSPDVILSTLGDLLA